MSSSSAQLRKIKKPLIEKKRRERMNECLNQLKILVLEGKNTNTSEPRYSKMEKVDILEMTVGYLRDLRRASLPPPGPAHPVTYRYIEGYNECAVQVGSYLENAGDLSEDARQRLRVHLLAGPLTRTPGDVQVRTPGDVQVRTLGDVQVRTPGYVQVRTPGDVQVRTPGDVQMRTRGDVQMRTPGNVQVRTPGDVQVTPRLAAFVEPKQPLLGPSPTVLPSVPKPVVLPLAWGGQCDKDGNSRIAAHSGTVAPSLSPPAATAVTRVYVTSPAITTGLSARQTVVPPGRFPVPVMTSPALLVVASAAAGSPYGLLCETGSPRQGDECPTSSAVFSPESEARGSTNDIINPRAESPRPSSTQRPLDDESTVDGGGAPQREGQTPPGSVWRPWNGQTR